MVQRPSYLSDDDIFGTGNGQSDLLSDDDIFSTPPAETGPAASGFANRGFPGQSSPINAILGATASAGRAPDRLASAGGSFVQGIGQTVSGVPRAVALMQAEDLDEFENFDRIDRGELPWLGRRPGPEWNRTPGPFNLNSDIVNRYQAASPEERLAIRAELRAEAEEVIESPTYQAGEAIDRWFAENFPSNPDFQEEFWTSKVPQGLGSAVSFMLSAIVSRGATARAGAAVQGAASFATPAALGAGLNSADMFEDALDNGASIEDALKAAERGALVGASEAIPIFNLLNRTDRASGGAIRRYLGRAIRQGTEEAIQETVVGVMNTMIAQDLYDPERQIWTDERAEEAAVGFTTGALLETLTSIVLPGRSRGGGSNQSRATDEQADASNPDPAAQPGVDPAADAASSPNQITAAEVREFANQRIVELEARTDLSESEAAELSFLTENRDNAEVVASAYGVELRQEALPAPVIAVNSAGEAGTAAQTDALAREIEDRGRELGLDEVREAQIGRVPPPDVVQTPPPLLLPAPQTVVTPQGEIGTPAQFEARDRAQTERATQLGLDEVANARIEMQPRPEAPGVRETARAAVPQLSDSDLASPIPNDLIEQGRSILADAEGGVTANRILESAGLPPINTEVTLATPDGPTTARIDDAFTIDGVAGVRLQLPDGRTVSRSATGLSTDLQTRDRAPTPLESPQIGAPGQTVARPSTVQAPDTQIPAPPARQDGPRVDPVMPSQTDAPAVTTLPQTPPTPEVARTPVVTREVADSSDVAATPTGRQVPVRYALVEAGSLVSSQLADGRSNPSYPADLQPRDRSRAASEGQIRKILDPAEFDPRQLGRSPTAGTGAPIISPEGVVESGNGRTLALTRAYQDGGEVAQRYRSYLDEQGFDTQGMAQPVLVRVREGQMTPEDLRAYTREANTPDVMGMSATEQAMADGAALSDSMLELYRGGDIDAAANRPFVREFISRVVGSNASASMIARDGSMNTEATRRIGGALLAKSYGNTAIVEAMTESTDTNIKAIGGALMDVAPAWARMRADAASGRISASMDQTERLLEAVALVDRARRERRSVSEYVNQTDMLSGNSVHPVAESFLGLMYHNARGWTRPVGRNKLATALRFYIEEAGKTQTGADMFGQGAPDPAVIAQLARERTITNGQPTEQADLLARPVERPGERPRADSEGGVQPSVPQTPAGPGGQAPGEGGVGARERNPELTDTAPVDDGAGPTPDTPTPTTTETPRTQSRRTPEDTGPRAGERIEDFGEELYGARKHYAAAYSDSLAAAMEGNVSALPLSKAWPEPDYQRLVDDGADAWAVAFVRAMRDEVPAKPRIGHKVERWASDVTLLRDTASQILSGDTTQESVRRVLASPQYARLGVAIWDRADLYQAVGHSRSLKGVSIGVGSYSMRNGETFSPPKTIYTVRRAAKATAMSNWPRELAAGDTREEAIAEFAAQYAKLDTQPDAARQVRFAIYSYRGGPKKGRWYIGKKIGRDHIDLQSFDTIEDARAYRTKNYDALVEQLARRKDIPDHRKKSNSPRVGVDHREGSDVSPEQFAETFGFRGVQFGNYVEGPRRQQDMNQAYDALLDLAGILDVPPLALSLNGQLGLAFGARGRGGKRAAAAHFESDSVVINLTKKQGAGSLAHEWWHAVDNHFARRRGAQDGYMTNSTGERAGETIEQRRRRLSLTRRAEEARRAQGMSDSVDATPAIRPEVSEAFRDLVRTINQTSLRQRSAELDRTRSKPYWATNIEMSARAFESYIIAKLQDQNGANEYLANIVSEDAWAAAQALRGNEDANYPYPTAGEVPEIRAGFDNLFSTIETRSTQVETEDGGTRPGVEMYRLRPSDDLAANADAVAEALSVQLAEAGLSDRVTLNVQDRIEALVDGRLTEADGRYLNGVIEIALDAPDASRALNHEIIHALRDMGLFRDAEWSTLTRAARGNAEMMDTIRQRYEGLDLTEDAIVEEAVAEMYAEWTAGRQQRRGFIRTAFDRIAAFFEALGNALRGNGFNAAADVFGRVRDGETGSRGDESAGNGGSAKMAAREMTQTTAFKQWFGDSKVVDENGEPLVVYHGSPKAPFEAFDPTAAGVTTVMGIPVDTDRHGFFFAEREAFAQSFASQGRSSGGEVMPVYLSIENPFRIVDFVPVGRDERKLLDAALKGGFFDASGADWFSGLARSSDFWEAFDDDDGQAVRGAMEAAGFDGVFMQETDPDTGVNEEVYVAFRPEQIKSVSNRGTFDPDDPRISYALRGGDFSPAQAERAVFSILKRDTSREGVTMQPAYAQADGTLTPDGGRLDNTVWKKPLGLFESATDKLRRSEDPALVDLGNRVDRYFDKNEARIGLVNGPLRPILKKLGVGVTSSGAKIEKVTAPFREYWQHLDNGRAKEAEAVLSEADEAIQELVEAVKDLFSEMGTQNQSAGVQVFDAQTNAWRPIGKLPRGRFWPRSLNPRAQAVLQNPGTDMQLWGRMVDALLNEGHIQERAEAKRYLSTYFTNEVKNDYFAGIEKARTVALPEIFYDYSWDAFQRYAWKWSSRISQIESFGQGSVFDRAGPPDAKNVFAEIISATMDQSTRNYVGQVAQHVYNVRSLDGYTAVLDNLNLIATGTQLGNPATATLNVIGGTQLNVQQFGWKRVAKAWRDLVFDWDTFQQEGVELGILGKDVLNILRDTERNDSYFDESRRVRDALGNFTKWTMTWGGYRGTENLIRATAMIAGRYQLNDALKAWNKNPASRESLQYRAYMRRNRIDPDVLLRENGDGPETARYMRLMVNIPQGSYRIDQTPLYVDSQLGRFLFKYQKFGTQVSRMFWEHFLNPFVRTFSPMRSEAATLPDRSGVQLEGRPVKGKPGTYVVSGTERVKAFLPILHWFATAFVGGSATLAARSFLFNYADPGPAWDDLAEALAGDDDLATKWAMIFDRAWYSMMAGSAFGFFGNYMQMGRDVADQQRVKNPMEPPGLASIDAAAELVQRFLEQGTLSGRDLDQIAEGTFAIYRGYKRMALTGIELTGAEFAEARLQAARRENGYIRKMARRFASEAGIETRRTITGRIGRTPRSPLNTAVSEALLVGDGGRARMLVQDALSRVQSPREREQIRSSLRSSIRNRQPILIAGAPSEAVRRNFLRWAEENTSPANYQTIVEADRRYRNAARVAGVW